VKLVLGDRVGWLFRANRGCGSTTAKQTRPLSSSSMPRRFHRPRDRCRDRRPQCRAGVHRAHHRGDPLRGADGDLPAVYPSAATALAAATRGRLPRYRSRRALHTIDHTAHRGLDAVNPTGVSSPGPPRGWVLPHAAAVTAGVRADLLVSRADPCGRGPGFPI